MIGVILSGHGGFASGISQALTQVIGEQPQFVAIDFPEAMTTAQLDNAMRQAIDHVDGGEGIVFLTDLLGGTPFRTASLLSQQIDNIEVVTGTNLQMAAEMLLEREGLSLIEFRQEALQCGHRGITSLFDQMEEKQREEITADDGI
ncbi:PTS galactosamine/N-acetylgalactosamine transporter subunit IIA [Enterovibrio coralii]|uniref:PTS N-acetylgalactosamine transporter subunit IIA n=1 Tax=Enterovibrio coralii TaxID=294935 RepID=A0A135I459_9GAMM|nr:PTS galactosamine/N-acetylgalactosamine transporter subunit IIA [Enterovibrio coralii]KXF80236.1 PTS N-acetylgalactosamine transporter subunit IIA [Enterovibrio coralii]